MTRQIFRKVALERLSSPEQLDQLMQITSPQGWLALLAFGLLLLFGLLWAIFGTIPTQISGPAILITSGGIKNIVASAAGQVETLIVNHGDQVTAGQMVATLLNDSGQTISVNSPYTGRILELKIDIGSMVERGTALASLEFTGNDVRLETILYLSPTDGKQVSPGMEVQIVPSTVRQEEYGYLRGLVSTVGDFPATYEGIFRTLGSDDLVQAMNIGTAPIEIHVELLANPATVSGYQWSSPAGPPLTIQSGTLATATIITGSLRPIHFIFP